MSLYASTKTAESRVSSEARYKTFHDQLEHKLSVIHNKIIFLSPRTRSRVRRGLINGLGSVVKSLTGNLDNDDAVKFEHEIANLNNQMHSFHISQKKSIRIAQKTMDEFSNQLNKINENQKKLSKTLLNVTSNSNVVNNHLHFLDIYVQLDFSLQIVLDKLMLLEDAMTFSQLGIMHPSIMSPQNLIFELIQLKTKYNFNLVAQVSIENIFQIERSIEVKAYSTEHTLTFILDVPSVDSNIFDLIHMYSIPTPRNLTIIPKSKYLALGSEEYTYLDGSCREITEDVQLCKHLDTRSKMDTDDCIISLIQHEKANCTYAKMNLKRGKIQNIDTNSWLVVTTQEEMINSTCGAKSSYGRLTGVHLISLTDQCQVQIMNTTLQTHINTILIQDVIPLPTAADILPEEIHYELQLEDISLDSIHQLINKADDLQEDIPYVDWPMLMSMPSWPTLILYIIGTALLLRRLSQWYRRPPPQDTSTTTPSGSTGTCFHLKEGRVTIPTGLVIAGAATTPRANDDAYASIQ